MTHNGQAVSWGVSEGHERVRDAQLGSGDPGKLAERAAVGPGFRPGAGDDEREAAWNAARYASRPAPSGKPPAKLWRPRATQRRAWARCRSVSLTSPRRRVRSHA